MRADPFGDRVLTTTALFVGIDVAKDHLDVHVRPTDLAFRVANDEGGIDGAVARLRELSPTLIVLEATGGYQIPVVAALAVAGLTPAVINPRQVRRFAESLGAGTPRPTRSTPPSWPTSPRRCAPSPGPSRTPRPAH